MTIRRMAAALGIIAIALAGCTSEDGASPDASGGGGESDCTVAVSWNNFQQPRWAAKDKPNIQETVEAGGGTYTDADANLDTEQQLTDIETFINQGADVLILLAQDNAGRPAGRRGCQGSRHSDHRVRPPDRGSGAPLHHVRQRGRRQRPRPQAMFEAVPEGNVRPDQG